MEGAIWNAIGSRIETVKMVKYPQANVLFWVGKFDGVVDV